MYHESHSVQFNRVKNHISKNKEIPSDVVLGVPILKLIGQTELLIENHRGIIEYTDCNIRIQTKLNQIEIVGTNLKILYYTNEEIRIDGIIKEIEYK